LTNLSDDKKLWTIAVHCSIAGWVYLGFGIRRGDGGGGGGGSSSSSSSETYTIPHRETVAGEATAKSSGSNILKTN
jgi:hypothetical protein